MCVSFVCFNILIYGDILFSLLDYLIKDVSLFLGNNHLEGSLIQKPLSKCLDDDVLRVVRYINLGGVN